MQFFLTCVHALGLLNSLCGTRPRTTPAVSCTRDVAPGPRTLHIPTSSRCGSKRGRISKLRSDSAHWDQDHADEVPQWPLRSGPRKWDPAVPTEIKTTQMRSRSSHWDQDHADEIRQRSGSAHWDQDHADEIPQCPLRFGLRSWEPEVPTEIKTTQMRSRSAHWDQDHADEVPQWPLRSEPRKWDPAVPTEIRTTQMRSRSAHWDLDFAVESRQCLLRSGAEMSWVMLGVQNIIILIEGAKFGRVMSIWATDFFWLAQTIVYFNEDTKACCQGCSGCGRVGQACSRTRGGAMPGQGPVSTESQPLLVDGDQVFEPLTPAGLFMVFSCVQQRFAQNIKTQRFSFFCFHWNILFLLCFHALGHALRFDRPAFLSTLFLAHNMTSTTLQRSIAHVLQRTLEDQRVQLLQNGLPFTVFFRFYHQLSWFVYTFNYIYIHVNTVLCVMFL